MDPKPRIFVIDDDPIVIRVLERLLRERGFTVESFTSPAAFLERPPYDGLACMLLDLRMPILSGLDVQEAMSRRGTSMPIVFLSAASDVPSTARAMREGAVDFLIKPIDESELFDAIQRATTQARALLQQRQDEREINGRLARLTKREREVCNFVTQGLLNKQIAHELGMSEKTVKVHRGRVMRKLEVDSVAALVRLFSDRPTRRLAS